MIFACCDERRLEVLRRSGSKNAIEFVEVLDRSAPPGVPRQQTLFVRLLRPGFTLTPDNLRISGGERIPTVGIAWTSAADALPPQAEPGLVDDVDELDRTLVIRTTSSGDFSRYTLAIVAAPASTRRPHDSIRCSRRSRSRSRSSARRTSTARRRCRVRRRRRWRRESTTSRRTIRASGG